MFSFNNTIKLSRFLENVNILYWMYYGWCFRVEAANSLNPVFGQLAILSWWEVGPLTYHRNQKCQILACQIHPVNSANQILLKSPVNFYLMGQSKREFRILSGGGSAGGGVEGWWGWGGFMSCVLCQAKNVAICCTGCSKVIYLAGVLTTPPTFLSIFQTEFSLLPFPLSAAK